MTEAPRKSATKPRGRPFQPGNAGKPKGTRHKATLAAEALLDGEAAQLTRKAVELALAGDGVALRLCLERILPPRKDRPVTFKVAPVNSPADAMREVSEILGAMGRGEVTPAEAGAVMDVLNTYLRAYDQTELERRIAELEAKTGGAP
ncbi:hypothetical protein ACO2Q3_22640 [Caulobacter sp. KR2-114]|uniref:hypothetical protein n=1 Tax=Caulobacter sp. KR2-114 TaxID=3400912 RepID=UPI003BFE53EE